MSRMSAMLFAFLFCSRDAYKLYHRTKSLSISGIMCFLESTEPWRCLTLEEIKTYCRIVTALEKTIKIQADIDTLYPQVEETLLLIKLKPQAG